MELLKGFLNLIYPPRCLICGKLLEDNDGLCEKCFQEIEIIKFPYCNICGKPLEPVQSFINIDNPICLDCRERKFFFKCARSIGKYKGVLKECIHLLKYKGKKVILKPLNKLFEICLDGLPFREISFIVPVPLHKKRLRERGFNQSELIAGLVGNRYQIPVLSSLLNKTVYTSPQVTLTRVERLRNIRGAFKALVPRGGCGTILLIDDVYTTGATVNECAKVLKMAGVKEVYVLTLAHGI